MIQAFAPRKPRGYSWVLLSILAILAWPCASEAQREKPARTKPAAESSKAKEKDDDAKKGDDEPKEKAKDGERKADEAEKPAEEAEAPKKEPSVEVFKDPRAESILKKAYPTVGRPCQPGDPKAVVNMAQGQIGIDRAVIQRMVDGMAYELTNKSNVAALTDPAGHGRKALAFKEATDHLLQPLKWAKQGKNTAFLTDYNRVLLAPGGSMSKLLDNNFFARIEAMIVLGQTGSPDALKVFEKQIKDANQTVWVKLWAARGVYNVTDGGTRELSPPQITGVAQALADWLDKEKDLPWPAQMRALEALGALRQARTPQKPDKPDFANVAMKFLADPEARPEVRATAAWALGMMRVDVSKFNFSLVAYNVGDVAAGLGEKIGTVFDANKNQSSYFAGFLLYQIIPALEGVPEARETGLLHMPGAAQAKTFVKQLDDLVKPVARSAVELINAPKGKYPALQKELDSRVESLRTFLQKNPPADERLVPGGPAFPVKVNQVAAAPPEK